MMINVVVFRLYVCVGLLIAFFLLEACIVTFSSIKASAQEGARHLNQIEFDSSKSCIRSI